MGRLRSIALAIVVAAALAAGAFALLSWTKAQSVFGPPADHGGPRLATREELGSIVSSVIVDSRGAAEPRPLVVLATTVPPCELRIVDCRTRGSVDPALALLSSDPVSPTVRGAIERAAETAAAVPCPQLEKVSCLSSEQLSALFVDRGWEDFKRRYPDGAFMRFSTPVMAGDARSAALYAGWYCGRLCASGELLMLVRQAGGWKVVARHGLWVS